MTTDQSIDPSQSLSSLSSWHHELPTAETEADECSVDGCEFSREDEGDAQECDEGGANGDEGGSKERLTDYDVELKRRVQPAVTLLPPPPSWFQFENDANKKQMQPHKKQMQSSLQEGHVKKAPVASNDEPAVAASANQPTVAETNTQLQSSEEELTSSQLDIPLLPKYNSPESQMFDMPLSFNYHATHDTNYNTAMEDDESDTSLSTSLNLLTTTLSSTLSTTLTSTSSTLINTTTRTLPTILQEYSSTAVQKALHKLKLEYARLGPKRYLRASDLGSVGGYFRPGVVGGANYEGGSGGDGGSFNCGTGGSDADANIVTRTAETSTATPAPFNIQNSIALAKGKDNHFDWMWMDGREVRFTNLPWVERQLVSEWRTYEWSTAVTDVMEDGEVGGGADETGDIDETGGIDEAGGVVECINLPKDKQLNTTQNTTTQDTLSQDDDSQEFTPLYTLAKTLAPRPLPRPQWEHASTCYACHRPFGPTLHRHHCRRCGHSYCSQHSNAKHALPHLGYDGEVCERVCRGCKVVLEGRDLEERVAWRLARCRDFLTGSLTPYFETGIDTVEDAALRLTRVAIRLARSIPLGAQAYVAIETVEILRKHGLSGVYGLLLRKEFLAAADLLCRILGINKKTWPLSVHELSAAIFYALAQHRALRGIRPDGEEVIHSLKEGELSAKENNSTDDSTMKRINSLYVVNESNVEEDEDAGDTVVWRGEESKVPNEFSDTVLDETDVYDPKSENAVDLLLLSRPKTPGQKHVDNNQHDTIKETKAETPSENQKEDGHMYPSFEPVCEPVPDGILSSLLFYAPLALNFIYAECEVDMQLLAAQQGWRLVYASLDQSQLHSDEQDEAGNKAVYNSSDKPASALFAHDDQKIACLSVRGTTSIQDVVTDIRAVPVPFPQEEEEEDSEYTTDNAFCDNDEWTSVFRGKGLASCGMAGAALNLFRENADALTYLAQNGYRIRIVGHSLGAGVATLLGILMSHHLEKLKLVDSGIGASATGDDRLLRVYGYGTPSCVDGRLADYTRAYATNVVLHDDVVPRLTPTSIRSLLKHLLHIRETWVKAHLSDDLKCYHERAYKVWPARVRESFSLSKKVLRKSAKKLRKSYKKRMQMLSDNNDNSKCTESGSHVAGGADEDKTYDIDDTESDSVDEGLDVEGDLFFDALNDDPLNESDDESSIGRARPNRLPSNTVLVECEDDWVPFDEPPMADSSEKTEAETGNQHDDQKSTTMDSSPQILEEFPLPRMFVPGKIVHIYTHRGGYKAAFVPRKFKSLRRISMAGNCLTDHMSKSYYESMLEVKTIRSAKYDLPQWVGFDQDCTCACCASLFTWASTSNTEAQAARDKHNCRSCGGLVCEPCSKNKVPIPSIGITLSVRVCDRCYNGWGALYNETNSEKSVNCKNDPDQSNFGGKKSTMHSRRSHVVDELAARLPSVK